LINKGVVSINGKKVDSYTQEIKAGDTVIIKASNFNINEVMKTEEKSSMLILLNKPKGYVASKADPHNKTIYDILPPEFKNYYYI
jgi:16S rRNA U516 pseudouridylate synthase RsuA-like enzyme